MLNFNYDTPTRILFGRDRLKELPHEISQYGSRVLVVYGKESVIKSGLLKRVTDSLKANHLYFEELGGIDPNPRLKSVIEGANICKEHHLDFVLALGGGSVIDCAKGIALATYYDGDPWDIWTWKAQVKDALPIGTVLTLAATGSEMNSGSVVTNENTHDKLGFVNPLLFPKFSILDPTLTFSVNSLHTAAGTVDIMAHVFEFYFTKGQPGYIQSRLAEAVLKTCIHYGPLAIKNPNDYEARANLMWASSLALNGVVSNGLEFDGFNHFTEHVLSGIYDITHGVGLAILIPIWMAYVLDETTVHRFAEYANNVWGINDENLLIRSEKGILKTKEFFSSLGLPQTLTEVGIDDMRFAEIAEKSIFPGEEIGNFKSLKKEDIISILEKAR